MQQVFALARSEPPNQAMRTALAARGLLPVHLPLLRLRRAYVSEALRLLFQQALLADLRIYVSKYAVRAAFAIAPQLKAVQYGNYAVGKATALLLTSQGVCSTGPLQGSGSEPLLSLPELQEVQGKTVAIFCAPDGRSLLAEQLAARGAQVINVYCYRRAPRAPSPLQAESCKRAVLTFAGSVAYLQALAPFLNRDSARQLPLLVASERIAGYARMRDFQRVYVCAGAHDEAILTGLSQVKW